MYGSTKCHFMVKNVCVCVRVSECVCVCVCLSLSLSGCLEWSRCVMLSVNRRNEAHRSLVPDMSGRKHGIWKLDKNEKAQYSRRVSFFREYVPNEWEGTFGMENHPHLSVSLSLSLSGIMIHIQLFPNVLEDLWPHLHMYFKR